MLILNKNILTIGGNRLEGESLTPPTPPGSVFDEVTIGSQTWMVKNLAIDDGGEGITIIDNNYYYTRDAARRVAETVEGWHLPSQSEFNSLISNGGGFNGLASTESWTYGGGNNSSGFTALATGNLSSDDTHYASGLGCALWTSTDYYFMNMYHTSSDVGCSVISSSTFNTRKCCVRLIKDT